MRLRHAAQASTTSLHNLDINDHWLSQCLYDASLRFKYAVVAKNESIVTPILRKEGCVSPTGLVPVSVIPATAGSHPCFPRRSVAILSFLAIFVLRAFRASVTKM